MELQMKNKKTGQNNLKGNLPPIPDIDIIDLESEDSAGQLAAASSRMLPQPEVSAPPARLPQKAGKKTGLSRINIHIVLLIVFILFILGLLYKFFNFGERVNLDEIFKDGPGDVDETYT